MGEYKKGLREKESMLQKRQILSTNIFYHSRIYVFKRYPYSGFIQNWAKVMFKWNEKCVKNYMKNLSTVRKRYH